jgi:hypothetical protein
MMPFATESDASDAGVQGMSIQEFEVYMLSYMLFMTLHHA